MIAVLTGDIVNSTKLPKTTYQKVIASLKTQIASIEQHYQASGDIYRGDEFQIQFCHPIDALKQTILIKLMLQSTDLYQQPIQCTLSLAFGLYETLEEKPNTSSGPVFIASGRGLEKAQRGEFVLRFLGKDNELDLLTQYFSQLLNRLTKTQSKLLYQFILNDFTEHKEIAKLTGTSRQNISKRLNSIGATLVKGYFDAINNRIQNKG